MDGLSLKGSTSNTNSDNSLNSSSAGGTINLEDASQQNVLQQSPGGNLNMNNNKNEQDVAETKNWYYLRRPLRGRSRELERIMAIEENDKESSQASIYSDDLKSYDEESSQEGSEKLLLEEDEQNLFEEKKSNRPFGGYGSH